MQPSPSFRYIGRKASNCRKCGCSSHYLNRMGGVVCLACSPPRTPADDVARLTIEGGVWIDPENRFELNEAAPANVAPSSHPSSHPTSPPILRGVAAATSPHRPGERAAVGSNPTRNAAGAIQEPLANRRGPSGEFSLAELDLFGQESIWAVGAGVDVTLVGGAVRWQGDRRACWEVLKSWAAN